MISSDRTLIDRRINDCGWKGNRARIIGLALSEKERATCGDGLSMQCLHTSDKLEDAGVAFRAQNEVPRPKCIWLLRWQPSA